MLQNGSRLKLAALGRILGLSIGFLLVCPLGYGKGKRDEYRFKFGLMTPGANGDSAVYLETKEIERHADPAYLHGFTISRKNGSQFYVYYKIRFPAALKDLPKEVYQYYQVLEGGRVLQSKEELVWNLSRGFVFSENDPLGTYQLEVYVDGQLYTTVAYNVTAVPGVGSFR